MIDCGFEVSLCMIRHAATAGNLRHAYIGVSDEELCCEGRELILKNIKEGLYPKAERVFTSPMLRCRQTAELIYPGLAAISIPQWREIDFGRFEGKNYEELNGDKDYQSWIDSNGGLPFPAGESREDFVKRTMEGLKTWADYVRLDHRPCAAIVHGGTIMAAASSLTGSDYYDFQIKNGQCCMFDLFITKNDIKLRAIEIRGRAI